MGHRKFSRRTVLKMLLATLAVNGCRAKPTDVSSPVLPTATFTPLPPTATAIPTAPPALPSAEGVVEAYLNAWQGGDFATMYALLTTEAHLRITSAQFEATYRHAIDQSTAQAVQADLRSLLAEGSLGTAIFHSQWRTSLFGDIENDHTMPLRFEDGQWRINWEPTLIFPQLGYGLTLALLDETVERGDILDAAGEKLATNQPFITIGVVPGQIDDRTGVVNLLATITGLPGPAIEEKILAARPDWFVPLADVDFDTSIRYYETLSGLAGVETRAHSSRLYPLGQSGGHMVGTLGGIRAEALDSFKRQGYRGDELVGQTGIEGWGEPFLAGRRGGRLVTLSPTGKELAEIASAISRPGGNIYLSLAADLQQRAEAILGAQRGAIVVMEPSGFIRAMASFPRFDPQDFATGIDADTWAALLNDDRRPLVNRAVQGTYPPASTFKIVALSAAMEKLGYTADTPFFCSGTWFGLGEDQPKTCWLKTGHGHINLQDGLTQSCDVVFYEVAKALHEADPAFLPDMARAFGLGQPTGLLGLDEAAGLVPDDAWKREALGEPFYVGDAVNMGIGQGYMLATPLQIARILAAIATDGQTYRPQIVRRISSRDTGDQFFAPESGPELPISAATLAVLKDALWNVAQGARGTARKAFDGASFTVAGKTGTAETGIDAPHAWFAGYAPAEDPAVVIAVIVENAGEGSEKAAPLFRLMAEAYFEWAAGDSPAEAAS